MLEEHPEYDVFISHSSADKAEVVQPLAEALRRRKVRVWLDEDELLLGDSIYQGIGRGLAAARFGIVVLSPSFFQRPWPENELGTLFAREAQAGRKLVLPVWHRVGLADVQQHAPLLADRVGVSTSAGLDHVVRKVMARLKQAERPPVDALPEEFARRRLARAVPLGLLARSHELLDLPRGEDGAARSLALALGGRIVVGRAYASQLHARALEVLERRGHDRVHWVTHWDDSGLNQLSIELSYRSVAGRHALTIENLTNYSLRKAAVEVIDPGGRSQDVAPGGRLEYPLDARGSTLMIVLGWGTGSQRLLHLTFELLLCGGVEVPTLRCEGTAFWVPPGDPAARLVQFFGIWLPLTAPQLTDLLRASVGEMTVRFARDPLALTFFDDPVAGAMVYGDVSLEKASGLA